MKKLLIFALLLISVQAFAAKKNWTYALYLENTSMSVKQICDSYNDSNSSIFIYSKGSLSDCFAVENKSLSKPEFFALTKERYDSWNYLFAVSSSSLTAVQAAQAVSGLRPTVLLLDVPQMGRLENIYELNGSAAYLSVFADARPEKGFDYPAFFASTPSSAEEMLEKAASAVKDGVTFFSVETGSGVEDFMTLFDSRAKCFDKKIDRFPRIKQAVKGYADTENALNIINKMILRKLQPVVKSLHKGNSEINGPLLYFPADKDSFLKTADTYRKTGLHRKYPHWTEFLELMHSK